MDQAQAVMDTLFGEGQSGLKVVLFVIVVLGLFALAFWLLRRSSGGRLGSGAARGRQPRLAVIDQATVDSRRRLVLIRRDNVEHLLVIGGPSDVVVEPNIVRAATALRETGPARPPAMPRLPVGEDSMWPLQPEPAPPGVPAPRKARTADRRTELANELSRVRVVGERAEQRRPPRLQPAPPVRSPAEAAFKPATAEMAQSPAPRKSRTADPLVKLADELSRVPGINEPAEQHRPPRLQPAPPARSTADAALEPAIDQNLSEIAERLEATLLRPAKSKEDARTAPGNPKTTGEQAATEPAAPSQEPETQGRADDKAASEPAGPPREPDTQGRGDDKALSEPAAPPREPDTQGRGDDKAPSEPATAPLKPDTPGRGDDGSNQK
jgi:flagellar protein FliO/FliZ